MSVRPQIGVLVGNPRAASRTLRVAVAAADALTDPLDARRSVVIDLASEPQWMSEPGSAAFQELANRLAECLVIVVASPTYKAAYSGLLKLFLDRYPERGLAGTIAIPLMTAAAPAHALAVEVHLRPLLVELGAAVPTAGLFVTEAQFGDLDRCVERWVEVAGAVLRPLVNPLA